MDRSGNPWAAFDNYIDRVALACVNQLTPKWSTKLAGYDVYTGLVFRRSLYVASP